MGGLQEGEVVQWPAGGVFAQDTVGTAFSWQRAFSPNALLLRTLDGTQLQVLPCLSGHASLHDMTQRLHVSLPGQDLT